VALQALQRSIAPNTQNWMLDRVQVGELEEHVHNSKVWTTGIYKKAVTDAIVVTRFGLEGDQHTGAEPDPDRAVCCHPLGHYNFWRSYFRRDIPVGFFGENLTISGVLDEDLCVGDVIRCGTTWLQVTQPRTPCYKQANKLGVPNFVKLIEQTGKLGFLMRVLEPGVIQMGDAFELIERPCPQVSLPFVNRKMYDHKDIDTARELANLDVLAQYWRDKFAEHVTKAEGTFSTDSV